MAHLYKKQFKKILTLYKKYVHAYFLLLKQLNQKIVVLIRIVPAKTPNEIIQVKTILINVHLMIRNNKLYIVNAIVHC